MAEVSTERVATTPTEFVPPWPGSHEMPRWEAGPLVDAPQFKLKNWFAMLGPGLLSAGLAIGGGEWLAGPAVTARYGGALMWLATLSIGIQVFYNLEISRYALYTGEPIFTGKFRTLPGPQFWLFTYLLLDFGAFVPYLAANAATPLAAIKLGHIPTDGDQYLVRLIGIGVLFLAMLPLVVGGRIYRTLKFVTMFKIVWVLGFLAFLAVFFSRMDTWTEILGGFVGFGTVPIKVDGDPSATENIFVSLWQGRGMPAIDLSTIALLASFAAIAGAGGLANAPISNYTRDQGWGMGHWVGSIPSVVGGNQIALSHVGMVFNPTPEAMPRWKRWFRHVMRDQLVVWLPACVLGMALPSMLSIQFLPRGTQASEWFAAGMTADGVKDAVAGDWGASAGTFFWYAPLFCGFMVLGPGMAMHVDGVVRRWVDVVWTSSRHLRALDPKHIRYVYFAVLVLFTCISLFWLCIGKPLALLTIASNIMNFALGFSCFHTLVINTTLLPKPLRPGWLPRIGLVCGGLFFLSLAIVTLIETARQFGVFG